MNPDLSRREQLLAVVFVFSSVAVAVFVLGNEQPNPQFWVCGVLAVGSFAAARRKLLLIMGLLAFAAVRFAVAMVLSPRWEAVIGLAVCGGLTLWLLLRTFRTREAGPRPTPAPLMFRPVPARSVSGCMGFIGDQPCSFG